jgi:hypothetical protein
MNNKGSNEEMSEREISALHQENTGPQHKRQAAISDRVLDAHIEAAMIPPVLCDFKNKWGWCLLEKGHEGSHNVVWLGDDD